MNICLISWPSYPADDLCGKAAALCTNYKGDPVNALNGAMSSGHESIAEHANFTFLIDGVSRVLLAQLTRHRIASFSVQSQRYAGLGDIKSVIIPDSIDSTFLKSEYERFVNEAFCRYEYLVKSGVPEEDARFVIPQGITTKLMMTMNARELRHFFSLRCCNRAQWEIRELADKMLVQCKQKAPVLFKDAGPGCVRGHCPEGKRSCCHSRRYEKPFYDGGDDDARADE